MFVIVVYDVSARRVAKVMKTCLKYFTHVQKSVFEGVISEAKLKQFQKEVAGKMALGEDQLCIYEFDSLLYTRKEQIGKVVMQGNIL